MLICGIKCILATMSKTNIIGTREVCHVLGVSRATVQRLTIEGTLTPEKLPGRTGALLYDRQQVESLKATRDRPDVRRFAEVQR